MVHITVIVLLNHLKQLLAQVNVLPGLEDRVRWICRELEIMLRFLMDYEDDNYDRGLKRRFFNEISDLAHESVDVVDRYVSDVAKHRRTNSTEPFPSPKPDFCSLGMSMEKIKNRIGRIDRERSEVELELIWKKAAVVDEPKLQGLSPKRAWLDEENVTVGLKEECEILVDRLINGGRPELEVISIIGDGGTGKTTLAKKVYNDVSVRNYFRPCVWILISTEYTLKNLLLSILKDIMVTTDDMYEMEEWQLKRQLLKQLRGRRYLVVMDDVWSTKPLYELEDAFPNRLGVGSRMIVTTRVLHGLRSVQPWFSYYQEKVQSGLTKYFSFRLEKDYGSGRNNTLYFMLDSLSEEDSWKLFCTKIFGRNRCPEELEPLGRRIVNCCGGWPLEISIVACVLRASDMSVSRWSNISSQISGRQSGSFWNAWSDILTVCYNDMPQYLKTCFLYLGVFPEDTEISVRQLIQLWIAEGLIWTKDNTTCRIEDVADDYLESIISRNLIQVMERRSDGGAKSCRIHDILRDLCINFSMKERYLVFDTRKFRSPKGLPILSDSHEHISIPYYLNSSCRSFSCFSEDIGSVSEDNWGSLFKRFPFLRVLNLNKGEVGKLPEAIDELFQLKYLRLRPIKNIRVPKSIFNLWNLQTIDLRTTHFPELPKGIWKMQQLRHLYLGGSSRLPKTESEECLPNLQTLSYISNELDDGICISEKAPNLRKLGLYEYRCFSKSEYNVTFNLLHIEKLKFAEECTFEGLEEAIKFPSTITKITVKKAHLQPNVIKIMEVLPNLQILKLTQTSFDDDELVFGEDSFPKLKLLKFEDSNIVRWRLEKGAVPNLHSLVISKCHLLTELPTEPLEVNKLKQLELFWASPMLAKKLNVDLKENKGLKLVIHSTSSE